MGENNSNYSIEEIQLSQDNKKNEQNGAQEMTVTPTRNFKKSTYQRSNTVYSSNKKA